MADGSRRSRTGPPTDPDERLQQRLGNVEGAPPPWRTIQTSDSSPLRIIRGQVASNGGTQAGTGFSANRVSGSPTGRYQVTFSTAYPSLPIVVATMYGDGASTLTDVLYVYTTSASEFRVACNWPGDGTARDRAFSFIAIGPA